jgi:hypothetical protein
MLSITHIVVTLFLIQFLTLDRNDAFVAMLFGVFIDVDHLFGLVKYTQVNGVASIFDFHSLMNPEGQWKSILHSPIAAAVVTPLSFAFRLAIPLLFWSVHLLMDFAEQTYLGHFSGLEAGLFIFAGLGLLTLRYGRHIMNSEAPSLSTYLRSEIEEIRNIFRKRPQTSF